MINILEDEWMPIDFKSNVQSKFAKIYSLEHRNKYEVNKVFNRLHKKEKMTWITQLTSHDYLVFVV